MSIKIRFKQRGFTLLEMLIAIGISGIILAVMAGFVLFSSRSFAALSNYVDLNQKSMRALDIMTREIRQAQKVTAITSNSVQVVDVDGNALTFQYYGPTHSVYPRKVVMIGVASSEVLLEDCDSFKVEGFRRNPDDNYNFFRLESGDFDLVKMIQIEWECYRDVFLGDRRTTESVQTAKVVLRYNPLKS